MLVQKITVEDIGALADYIVLHHAHLYKGGKVAWSAPNYISATIPASGEMTESWTPNSIADKLELDVAWIESPDLELAVYGTVDGSSVRIPQALPLAPRQSPLVDYVRATEWVGVSVALPVGKEISWLPMPPNMGPPLPEFLQIYWPWYEK